MRDAHACKQPLWGEHVRAYESESVHGTFAVASGTATKRILLVIDLS